MADQASTTPACVCCRDTGEFWVFDGDDAEREACSCPAGRALVERSIAATREWLAAHGQLRPAALEPEEDEEEDYEYEGPEDFGYFGDPALTEPYESALDSYDFGD